LEGEREEEEEKEKGKRGERESLVTNDNQ